MKDIPTICPVCGSQLNIDDEYMHRMYDNWEDDLPVTFWIFYCSSRFEHRGLIGELSVSAEELQKETKTP